MDMPKGRAKEVRLFQNCLKSDRLSQAYILHAEEGMGKKTLMRYILSLIMCETHSSCGRCPSCKSLEAGAHPDVYELKRPSDRASIGVEAVRSIPGEVYIRPVAAKYKAVIVHEAHLLTAEAQNAMLKVIEEPPDRVVFFLLCDTLAPILRTVLSRCVVIDLKPLGDDILREAANGRAGEFEISYSCSNPGKLLRLISDGEFKSLRDGVIDKTALIASENAYCVYEAADFFERHKDRRDDILNIITIFMRDALYRKLGMQDSIINKDKLKQIDAFSKACGAKECFKALCTVLKTVKDKGKNGSFNIAVTTMLFKCREEINGRGNGSTF